MPTYWRVMGMWRDGRQFLVVLGKSPGECLLRLDAALADWDCRDALRAESLWFERWDPGTWLREPRWVAMREIPLRRFKRAALARPEPLPMALAG